MTHTKFYIIISLAIISVFALSSFTAKKPFESYYDTTSGDITLKWESKFFSTSMLEEFSGISGRVNSNVFAKGVLAKRITNGEEPYIIASQENDRQELVIFIFSDGIRLVLTDLESKRMYTLVVSKDSQWEYEEVDGVIVRQSETAVDRLD